MAGNNKNNGGAVTMHLRMMYAQKCFLSSGDVHRGRAFAEIVEKQESSGIIDFVRREDARQAQRRNKKTTRESHYLPGRVLK